MTSPVEVVQVLDKSKIVYLLVGAHAANGYTGEPRATVDVVVLVRFPNKATAALVKAFPQLRPSDNPVVTRLLRPDGECAIDFMKASTSPLWGRLIKLGRTIKICGTPVRIPPVEGVLAAKFAAMASPHRSVAKKMIDGGDFIHIVQRNPKLDTKLLEELADLVYSGGGRAVLQLFDDARAGRQLTF